MEVGLLRRDISWMEQHQDSESRSAPIAAPSQLPRVVGMQKYVRRLDSFVPKHTTLTLVDVETMCQVVGNHSPLRIMLSGTANRQPVSIQR